MRILDILGNADTSCAVAFLIDNQNLHIALSQLDIAEAFLVAVYDVADAIAQIILLHNTIASLRQLIQNHTPVVFRTQTDVLTALSTFDQDIQQHASGWTLHVPVAAANNTTQLQHTAVAAAVDDADLLIGPIHIHDGIAFILLIDDIGNIIIIAVQLGNPVFSCRKTLQHDTPVVSGL